MKITREATSAVNIDLLLSWNFLSIEAKIKEKENIWLIYNTARLLEKHREMVISTNMFLN